MTPNCWEVKGGSWALKGESLRGQEIGTVKVEARQSWRRNEHVEGGNWRGKET
jgi:hypothetical protein